MKSSFKTAKILGLVAMSSSMTFNTSSASGDFILPDDLGNVSPVTKSMGADVRFSLALEKFDKVLRQNFGMGKDIDALNTAYELAPATKEYEKLSFGDGPLQKLEVGNKSAKQTLESYLGEFINGGPEGLYARNMKLKGVVDLSRDDFAKVFVEMQTAFNQILEQNNIRISIGEGELRPDMCEHYPVSLR